MTRYVKRVAGGGIRWQRHCLHRTAVHEFQTPKHLIQTELMMLLSQVVVRLDNLSRAVSAARPNTEDVARLSPTW
jgi:hypothetical protein